MLGLAQLLALNEVSSAAQAYWRAYAGVDPCWLLPVRAKRSAQARAEALRQGVSDEQITLLRRDVLYEMTGGTSAA